MRTYTVESSVTIAAPIEAVYGFHLDVANLSKISPSWISATLVKEEGEGLGKLLYLKMSVFGVASNWVVKIDEYDPPFRLTDLVLHGPLPYFRHTRTFRQPSAELTELHDKLEYAVPFGFIGRMANALSIRRMIELMFNYRHRVTKERLEVQFFIKVIPIK